LPDITPTKVLIVNAHEHLLIKHNVLKGRSLGWGIKKKNGEKLCKTIHSSFFNDPKTTLKECRMKFILKE
jgi:hypothetical protein